MDDYQKFLQTKRKAIIQSGFKYTGATNDALFDFQRFILLRAIAAGKYALFADCGLGKTLIQLEWARIVSAHVDGRCLILAPLAVTEQTKEEAIKFQIDVSRIDINNYEQIENIDTSIYSAIVLDESGILKNFTGATKKKIIEAFKATPYKLACTATPAPNDPVELGNHAEFLDVMSRNEMLAMYFVHDAGDTGLWRLKGHAVNHFYQFIATWAIMLNKPADIGYHIDGYDLPPLNFFEYKIQTESKGESLFNDDAVSAIQFNAELRRTKKERLDKAVEIVNKKKDESFIIWIKQNQEGDYLRKMLPEAVEVKGSDPLEQKKRNLIGFGHGEFRILITKAKIAQFGLNYQNCHNQIFASLDFSFEGLYQAMRRSYRFGQTHTVDISIITTDTMQNVIEAIKEKQEAFIMMQGEMSDSVNATMNKKLMMQDIDYDTDDVKTDDYLIRRGDCVRLIKELQDNSVGFSVFSPPFADLFTYSSHVEDMGNCKDYNQFVEQFKYLVKELFRVIKSGRNVAVHSMDLPIQKGKEGFIGLRDFTGMIRETFEASGFIYHSRITIWKNPVTEMQRTKALGLLHKQIKKDSTMCRVGIPDTIMIFRKDGDRDDPVQNTELDVDTWQQYASPVWMDIDQGDTLNARVARENEDEKHLCPLQLQTIKRLIHLYTNIGDTVLTPFMGIGSELHQALRMGRKGIGFELKESYYDQAKKNIDTVMKERNQLDLSF